MRFFGTERSVSGELQGTQRASLEAATLSTQSLNGNSTDEEILRRVKQTMRETGASFRNAFKAVMASDQALTRRYRATHHHPIA